MKQPIYEFLPIYQRVLFKKSQKKIVEMDFLQTDLLQQLCAGVKEELELAIDKHVLLDALLRDHYNRFAEEAWQYPISGSGAGDKIIRWSYEITLENPSLEMTYVYDRLQNHHILKLFANHNEPNRFLFDLASKTDDSGKLIADLTEYEFFYEVSNYISTGVCWAKYYGFLKEELIKQTAISNIDSATVIIEKLMPTELANCKNNFDGIMIETVYKHFKAGLVDKGFLSETDLYNFISFAFDKTTPPSKRFSLSGTRSKQNVIKVFSAYYRDVAGRPHGRKVNYANLLGEYFLGYTTKRVSSNFSR